MSLVSLIRTHAELRNAVPKLKNQMVKWDGEPLLKWDWQSPILVPSVGKGAEPSYIGTAVDYVMRAQLTRKVGRDRANVRTTVAESALRRIARPEAELRDQTLSTPIRMYLDDIATSIPGFPGESRDAKKRRLEGIEAVRGEADRISVYLWRRFCEGMKAVESFIDGQTELADLAPHALFLARLDPVVRVGLQLSGPTILDLYLEDTIGHRCFGTSDPTPEPQLTDNVVQITGIFNRQLVEMPVDTVICNPAFHLPGGADADFVLDQTLIDVKSTKDLGYHSADVAQVLGYAALATLDDLDIQRVGIYFARYGIWAMLPLSALPDGWLEDYRDLILEHAGTSLEEIAGWEGSRSVHGSLDGD